LVDEVLAVDELKALQEFDGLEKVFFGRRQVVPV
jgi:hypothetical protein